MNPIIHLIYVDPIGGEWRVSGETPQALIGTFKEKDSAIAEGRAAARKLCGQMIVRKADQTVEFAEDFASVER